MPQLIIVGSGTGIPSLRRGSPGLLLISRESSVLIDSGPGALRGILKTGVSYPGLDLLLYTHIHPDHVADLVSILFAFKYTDPPREKDLLCMGGPGFHDYFEKLKDIYGEWIETESYRLNVKEMSGEPFSILDLTVRANPTAHLSGSVAYRVEFADGSSVAVSGDTDYCRGLVDLAMEVDLLVLECSFPDEKKVRGHLTPSLAGRIAVESRCKRLLLTHLYPICDQFDIAEECSRWYRGEIVVAEDSMKIEI